MIQQLLVGGDSKSLMVAMLVGGCIMMIMMAMRSSRNRRSSIAEAALAGRDGNQVDIRQVELTLPASERVFKPLIRSLTGLGRVITPSRNIAMLQHDLIMSGLISRLSVTDFLGLRFLAGAMTAVGGFMTATALLPPLSAIMMSSAAFMVGLYIPNFWLRSRVSQRQKDISRSLPDALDMMSICVDAGLGFEAALQKVAWQWDNELSQEFRRVISEIRVGMSRVDSLRHMVERTNVPDVSSFVAVLVQADQLGIAIKDVLHTQAEQMRVKRRQRAQESAQKAPLKMLFPLVFFIFPSMFAVILGPAIPKLMSAFK